MLDGIPLGSTHASYTIGISLLNHRQPMVLNPVDETASADDVDDTTTVEAQVGGSGFNGPSHFAFAVRGGLVVRMTIRA